MPEEARSAKSSQSKSQATAPVYSVAIEGAQQAAGRWLESLMGLSQEVARFTQIRLQEDLTQWQVLATCHSPQEAIESQQRYFAKVGEEYAQEFSKLGQMVMKAASEGLPKVPAEA